MTAPTLTAQAVAPTTSPASIRSAIGGLRSEHDLVQLLPGVGLHPDGGVRLRLVDPVAPPRSWTGQVAIDHGTDRVTVRLTPGPTRPDDPTATFAIAVGDDGGTVEVGVEVVAGPDGELSEAWRRAAAPLASLLARNLAAPTRDVVRAVDEPSRETPRATSPMPTGPTAAGDDDAGPRRPWLLGAAVAAVAVAAGAWWTTRRKGRS
jgi:hypothetical protein